MPCYTPLTAWRARKPNASGKRSLVFNRREGDASEEVTIPCGQCIGCRLERSRQWAVRCVHEASLHKDNCFLTLTYNNDNLPANSSLDKRHFTLFMKRLRKAYGAGIRFFACGEYGTSFRRPHYHCLLFGFDFVDRFLWRVTRGIPLYRSSSLEDLWPFGFCVIGAVTFDSAAYVARYIIKKYIGRDSRKHYDGRVSEYIVMSRRPGIGRNWIDKYMSDVYPHDYVVIRDGIKCKPPKYYDSVYDVVTDDIGTIKFERAKRAVRNYKDNSPARLEARMEVKEAKIKKCRRGFEEGDL